MLIKQRHYGAITTFGCTNKPLVDQAGKEGRQCVRPGAKRIITNMDDNLIAGVFSKENGDLDADDDGLIMLVDSRTAMSIGALPKRTVHIVFAAGCAATVVEPGVERTMASMHVARAVSWDKVTQLSLELNAGEGALIEVTGTNCGALIRTTRPWWFDPRSINLRHDYPQEESVKSTTYGAYGAPTRHYIPNSVGAAAAVANQDGGGTGAGTNFLLGGSWWETTNSTSETQLRALVEGGFGALSLPTSSSCLDNAALEEALLTAAKLGTFIFGTAQCTKKAWTPATLQEAASAHSCRTNFGGFVLGATGGKNLTQLKANLATQKMEAYWTIPLVLDVTDAAAAKAIALAGGPLPAVGFAAPDPSAPASVFANQVIATMASVQAVANDVDVPMTAVYMLKPCDTNSSSLLRFQAFASLALGGAQALWWEGLGACARPGSAKFDVIATTNRRLLQWAPLFLKESATPPYAIDRIWSTAGHLVVPSAVLPGANVDDIVQHMDTDLIAISFRNVSNSVLGGHYGPLLFIIDAKLDTQRDVELRLRKDVALSTPLEGGDAVSDCTMRRLRNVLPLTLMGGDAQLVSYALLSSYGIHKPASAAVQKEEEQVWTRTRSARTRRDLLAQREKKQV